jgi:hypothetical protein
MKEVNSRGVSLRMNESSKKQRGNQRMNEGGKKQRGEEKINE